MITLEIQNSRAVIEGFDRSSVEMRQGVSDGIQKSVNELAGRVAADTPVRSGKARAAVYGKLTSPLRGEVGYAKEVRWYMRIVELSGSRPHVIIAKALRGRLSGVTRGQLFSALVASRDSTPTKYGTAGEAKTFNRNARTFDRSRRSGKPSSSERLFQSLKAAGVDQSRLGEFKSGLKVGARALSFESKGTHFLRSAVLHPGIKSHLVLRTQLARAEQTIAENIRGGIRARLAQPGVN